MDEKVFWGKWDCTSCSNKGISGKLKQCPTCGNPREQHELDKVYIGATANPDGSVNAPEITDPEERELALAGPDWSCGYCGSNERNDRGQCRNCGGSRSGEILSYMPEDDQPGLNVQPRQITVKSGRKYTSYDFQALLKPPPRVSRRKLWIIGGSTIAVVALTLLIIWGFQTHEVWGEVSEMRWTHHAHVERWKNTVRGDWSWNVHERSEIKPRNGKGERAGVIVTGCYQKHHHYERYQCGTRTESYTERHQCGTSRQCTTRSNSNGSFTQSCTNIPRYCTRPRTRTVPKYCDRSIRKRWCDYVTQHWDRIDTATYSGEGTEDLKWPQPTTGPLDRLRFSGDWVLVVEYDDGDGAETHEEELDGEEDYLGWAVGDPVVLSIRNWGNVASIRKGELETE